MATVTSLLARRAYIALTLERGSSMGLSVITPTNPSGSGWNLEWEAMVHRKWRKSSQECLLRVQKRVFFLPAAFWHGEVDQVHYPMSNFTPIGAAMGYWTRKVKILLIFLKLNFGIKSPSAAPEQSHPFVVVLHDLLHSPSIHRHWCFLHKIVPYSIHVMKMGEMRFFSEISGKEIELS